MSKLLQASIRVSISNNLGVQIKSRPLPITQHNYRRFIENFREDHNVHVLIEFLDGSKTLVKEINKDYYLKNKTVVV